MTASNLLSSASPVFFSAALALGVLSACGSASEQIPESQVLDAAAPQALLVSCASTTNNLWAALVGYKSPGGRFVAQALTVEQGGRETTFPYTVDRSQKGRIRLVSSKGEQVLTIENPQNGAATIWFAMSPSATRYGTCAVQNLSSI
jgi:hypothetical protein